MTLVSKSEFARLYGVSHTAVAKWNKSGWLVTQGSQVVLEESNAKLAQYRDSKDGRAAKVSKRLKPETKIETSNETKSEAGSGEVSSTAGQSCPIEFLPGESIGAAEARLVGDLSVDLNMPVEEAKRIKEVYLALLNRLEYEQKSGALVELAVAQAVLFEASRGQRDAWLNWPAKIGPLLAAELGLEEADRVTEALTAHVHKQISDLGEPAADFSAG